MHHFHRYRGNRWSPAGLYNRMWALADRVPMPPPIGAAARTAVYLGRRGHHAVRGPVAAHGPPISGDTLLTPASELQPLTFEEAVARFELVHEANECVRRTDGSWDPNPIGHPAGWGPTVEEAALRVPGYLEAFDALGRPAYLERAEAAGEHILGRMFAGGHLHLRGHLVPDLPYAFAGSALLLLWQRDPSGRADLLAAAQKIGDQLLGYPIAGSANHACAPVWLLTGLYRATATPRYLSAAVRRVRRTALAFQLPDGAWAGHESWPWYHGIITRALVDLYASVPFYPQWYRLKDRLAAVITRALNRFASAQQANGGFDAAHVSASRRERREVVDYARRETAVFDGRSFSPAPDGLHVESGYEMDALVAATEQLGTGSHIADGLARRALSGRYVRRLEFDTLAAGRYLSLLHDRAGRHRRHSDLGRSG